MSSRSRRRRRPATKGAARDCLSSLSPATRSLRRTNRQRSSLLSLPRFPSVGSVRRLASFRLPAALENHIELPCPAVQIGRRAIRQAPSRTGSHCVGGETRRFGGLSALLGQVREADERERLVGGVGSATGLGLVASFEIVQQVHVLAQRILVRALGAVETLAGGPKARIHGDGRVDERNELGAVVALADGETDRAAD